MAEKYNMTPTIFPPPIRVGDFVREGSGERFGAVREVRGEYVLVEKFSDGRRVERHRRTLITYHRPTVKV